MYRHKILHASQASSGGVLNALVQLSNSQTTSGADVHVILCRRADTPGPDRLRALFHPSIVITETPILGMGPAAGISLFLELRRVNRKFRPDFVHLHSSFAGAVGRFFALLIGGQSRTFYSPHGFAFLRRDVANWKRRSFAFIEKVLHSFGGSMILVSHSELSAAQRTLSTKRLYVLENGIDIHSLPKRMKPSERPLVGTAGRVTYQKAPWLFASLASALANIADSVWIGGGSKNAENDWLSSCPVEVSGWLSERSALERLAAVDVYVSTSLWEGLPIAVLQAQALGIPCVVSDCVGNVDVVEDGVTGFVVSDASTLHDRVVRLINDPDLRFKMGLNAKRMAVPRFDSKRLGPESFRIYEKQVQS